MQSLGRNLPLRRDPAPSRWSYRMQRLWLTPLFRMLFRVGVPVVLLAGSAGLVLHDQGRRDAGERRLERHVGQLWNHYTIREGGRCRLRRHPHQECF